MHKAPESHFRHILPLIPAALLALLSAAGVTAQPFSGAASSVTDYARGTTDPMMDCAALENLELRDVLAISVTQMPAEGDIPAHCRVDGTIDPEITFQVNLPDSWNERFYMIGNGGLAGQQPDEPRQAGERAQALRHHFVMATTDTGHDASEEPGGSFILSNPQKAIDYAWRAVHLTAVTAKEIARQYYGEPVSYSYWNSCSNGGRQGLMEAQRFPDDFDGVVSNAPWVSQTGFTIGALWNQRVLDETPLSAAKLSVLADSVMNHCDAVDGLEDGLIDDPRNCPVNVAEIVPLCAPGADGDACLTPAQAYAAQRIYDGPRTSSGEQIFPGFEPGSEQLVNGSSSWMGLIVPSAPGVLPADMSLAMGFMEYLVPLTPRPGWDYSEFDFDTDVEDLDYWARLGNATDINLREFRANGGKLIITYGWADTILQPMMGVDYYEQAVTANGPDGTDFMRLFMAPGMTHCAGGLGPDQHDAVSAIIDWVEAGVAPDSMVATRSVNGEVVRSRPLCPYPQVARYDGSGSIDEADNFSCVVPQNAPVLQAASDVMAVPGDVQAEGDEQTETEECTERGGLSFSLSRGFISREACEDSE